MKLSEAIRLGAMLHPQGFDDYRNGDGHTCALGAAQDALGVADSDFCECHLWPWLDSRRVCPSCNFHSTTGEIVTHLNDSHRWTREQIADWVETIEQQHEAPTVETPVHVHAG